VVHTANVILERLGAGIAVLDANDGVVFLNPKAEVILGEQADPPRRHALPSVRAIEEAITRAPKGGEARAEWVIDRQDGSQTTLGYQAARLPEGTYDPGRYLLLFQDITTVAQLRQEHDRLLQLATVGETLPTLLHELKNPLAAISSTVEVLIEESVAGPLRDDLHAILSEVRRMRLAFEGIGLVGDTAVRSERHSAIDLAIREAAQILISRARSIRVDLSIDVATMPLLPFSSAAVRAIVFNLVRNALDASSAEGVVRVAAHFDANTKSLVLSVKDHGKGMSRDVLARCRDLFFTTKANGSGIGLALCARVVEQAEGTMTIRSELGAGTEVRISLPITQPGGKPDEQS
jgi:signal transduction histidine kinase